ncbi:DUF3995 domain-containing protein [Paraburkholderia sacchari]|uniref:DUF3995 domain-containing protein n=1 Tax=Paraburkholderia sacchari TaxID=159450 RepID=UPI001BCBDA76|nr:DUF3995 domain-containing protein [Paraburkholderia sacchari]
MSANCFRMLEIALATAYLAIALLHLCWALGAKVGVAAAVPSVDGRFVFQPGRVAILSVGALIAGCSVLLYAWAGVLALPLPRALLRVAVGALGVAMLARAVGDFRHVGFFRVFRQSPFAHMDKWIYTPFCIAAGAFLVASAALRE